MTVATGGYGLPEEGSLVTGGMGASEPAAPGAISATLTGTGSVTAAITSTDQVPGVTFGGGASRPLRTIGVLSADLSGSSRLTAAIDFDVTPLAWQQLEALLLLEMV